MADLRAPKVSEQRIPVLDDDELRALLKTCAGNTFEARRDAALIMIFVDSGARLAEVTGLTVEDVDLRAGVVRVLGKGDRERLVGIGRKTAAAVDRYLRVRNSHPRSDAAGLWLGPRGPMTVSGIAQMVSRRGREAGIEGLHPHVFQHTWAHYWKSAGGGEEDLMRLYAVNWGRRLRSLAAG